MSIRPLLIAVQFLTRFPVWLKQAPRKQELGWSVVYFPMTGLFIGLALYLTFSLLALCQTPQWLSAALLLTVWVIITGGLHLDGLADSVDGWAGGGDNQTRILEIMKDPTCGAMAVIAIFLVLMLKLTGLVYFQAGGQTGFMIAMPLIARVTIPLLFVTTPYVRAQGIGADMSAYLPRGWATFMIIISYGLVIMIFGHKGLLAVLGSILAYYFMRRKMLRTLGGATGDTIGAMVEIVETVVLLTFVV